MYTLNHLCTRILIVFPLLLFIQQANAQLPTSINVGTGQTYTSLSGASGLFNAINTSSLTGNTTVSITSDLSEDGTVALNATGMGSFSITIQPSAASLRIISNSTDLATAMLRIDGASNVTLDGRSGGSGQYLRVVNTHTTASSCQPAITVLNNATNNIIRNCIVESNETSAALGTITMGVGTNSLSVIANDIRDAQGSPGTAGVPAKGIYSNTVTNTITVGGTTAADGNNIYNFTTSGINLANIANGAVIRYNNVYQTAARASALQHIFINAGSNHTVSNNNIYQTSGTNTGLFIGITVQGGGTGQTINNNSIGGSNASRSGAAFTVNVALTSEAILLAAGIGTASNIQGNSFSNFANITTATSGVVNGFLVTSGTVNIGTTTPNILGGGANAWDTLMTAYDNGWINYSGTGTVDIENNIISNCAYYRGANDRNCGITISAAATAIIKNNLIHDIKSNSTSNITSSFNPFGMFISGAITASSNIEGNSIYNIQNFNTFTITQVAALGIQVSGALTAGVSFQRNKIYNIQVSSANTGANAPIAAGININSGSNACTFSNNEITIGSGSGGDALAYGIYDNSSAAHKYYYNTIAINGSMTGNNRSACYYRNTTTSVPVIRNNLFYNTRSSSGTGGQYAISTNSSSGWTSSVSNYNLFVVSNLNNMGEYVTGTPRTLAQWQASSGGDANSTVQTTATLPSASFFTAVSTGDLSIPNSMQGYVAALGTPVSGVTTDYMGTTRSSTTPSVGAFETSFVWTGTTNTNWSTSTNWLSGAVPTSTDVAVIPGSLANYPIMASGTISAGGIVISSGGTLTVSGGTLQVAGSISNAGTFNATGGTIELNGTQAQTIAAGTINVTNFKLNNSAGATISSGMVNVLTAYQPVTGTLAAGGFMTLKSTISGTAYVEEGFSGGGYISGNVIIERYIPAGKRALRLFAHPFSASIALSSLIDNIDISGLNGSANGFTNNAAASAYWFDVSTANNTPSKTNPGWTDITNTNGVGANAWAQYQGMSILVRGIKGEGLGAPVTPSAVTLDFAGALNQGNLVVTATKGSSSTLVLIGNPYPSNINVNTSTRGSNIGSSFYVWDPYSGTKGAYVTNTFGSSYILPAYASFFVTASANTNNTITFHEGDKTAASATASLFKTTTVNNGAYFKLYSNSDSIKWDEYRLRFDDHAAADSEWYDGIKMYNPDASLYSFSKNGTPLAIDVRPYAENEIIPMGLIFAKIKSYTLTTEELDMPAGTKLFLRDKYLNNTIELKAGDKYQFDVTADVLSQGDNRFELNTSGTPTTVTNTTAAVTSVKLVPNPATENVTIRYEGFQEGAINITIWNTVGVKVAEVQKASDKSGSIQMSLQNIANGVYMVTVQNGNQSFTQRLVKQ